MEYGETSHWPIKNMETNALQTFCVNFRFLDLLVFSVIVKQVKSYSQQEVRLS